MKIEVVEHQAIWQELFSKEALNIQNILKDEALAIHHIGSTAVPKLKAKPIIDILVVVRDISKVDLYQKDFQRIGYEAMGEFGIPGRRYFRKGQENRTHQIHMFEESNNKDITRHLAVRDYLRAHPQAASSYGDLKSKLAKQHPNDIQAYSEGKEAFVKALERKALEWYTDH